MECNLKIATLGMAGRFYQNMKIFSHTYTLTLDKIFLSAKDLLQNEELICNLGL